MPTYRIPFGGRAHHYPKPVLEKLNSFLAETSSLTQGEYLQKFEYGMSSYIGSEAVLAVANATCALELVAQYLFAKEGGGEIIIPAHTYTSSAYPFAKAGFKIKWADIDPETRVINTKSIERVVSKDTKAIVVVHLYGYIADINEIVEYARAHKIQVIEDTAQAIGTWLDEKHAGTSGDFGVFSFHSHKNISTLGEGGLLSINNPDLLPIFKAMRHNGHMPFPYAREHYWLPAMSNADMPEFNGSYLQPNNYCMAEANCLVGLEMIPYIASIISSKRDRAIKVIDRLSDYETLRFHRCDSARHNYHLLVAKVEGDLRDKLIASLAFDFGIQCATQYYPLYLYDYYKKIGAGEANCPHTEQFFDSMISFPFQSCITDDDIDYMVTSTETCIDSLGGAE
ncbi:DegT/DnrJ/EryC1/StrS family aminotransferase [Pseudobacteriovorax antillogorgiicola]|uniref:dTDP-4-amino-4,6-dideoxygalactose transaminase n=1 Tax=Pseudobacteriovorax antillogorgiicola TaxID=1513793 RepID=A0A1Y6CSZ4_9BACT|nr:aminotransferase class V-fold PLP-dependent enzyme [Pseudobacteriovorax antillogorgiicola]TCS45187.1 dTDP-4-amino-4,6-dideoxygalactose transaminase [Pseudobacteriovorax antillogorgiicola]SMF75652.1 dTDP-4-amino-4,6-dideoxygalactose transaminase [Pseudobacteriovorax antillogorgiicola]